MHVKSTGICASRAFPQAHRLRECRGTVVPFNQLKWRMGPQVWREHCREYRQVEPLKLPPRIGGVLELDLYHDELSLRGEEDKPVRLADPCPRLPEALELEPRPWHKLAGKEPLEVLLGLCLVAQALSAPALALPRASREGRGLAEGPCPFNRPCQA